MKQTPLPNTCGSCELIPASALPRISTSRPRANPLCPAPAPSGRMPPRGGP